MKGAPVFVIVIAIVILDVANCRPLESDPSADDDAKAQKNASVYILGSINNAAISHGFSKTQAASDRNESEWNNTDMNNKVRPPAPVSYSNDEYARSGGLLIYSGGDAANLALAYQGSESQAAENDQKSGYNNQNLGLAVAQSDVDEVEEDEDEDEK